MVPSVATPLCGNHRLHPLTLGCYISRCHLARLSKKHMPFGANAVRGTLAEQAFGSAANTFVLQLHMQQHSHFVNAYALSGGLWGGSVQSAYIPVAAMLFGPHLVDLLPCCCYTSAVQLAMTSVLGQVFFSVARLHCQHRAFRRRCFVCSANCFWGAGALELAQPRVSAVFV